jgi:hypothetical protein
MTDTPEQDQPDTQEQTDAQAQEQAMRAILHHWQDRFAAAILDWWEYEAFPETHEQEPPADDPL